MDIDRSLQAFRALLLLSIGLPACVGGDKGDSVCEGSTAILDASGAATGYERCDDGSVHRVSAVAVSSTIEGESCRGDEEYQSCTTDADCTYGRGSVARCIHDDSVDIGGRMVPGASPDTAIPEGSGCNCAYSCATDADCGDGFACVPTGIVTKNEAWSTCVPAACSTDSACESGECGVASYDDGCGYNPSLACRTDADECRSDEDCDEAQCAAEDDEDEIFACREMNCAIGRPLSVEGGSRTAGCAPRGDWVGELVVGAGEVSGELRAALGAWWTDVAAMEHASVGSFARFTLELLSLGAPPELLAETQRAAADEVAHARLAYTLAGIWRGEAVGPGPLSLDGVRPGADAAAILRALVEEACVGETLGAAEARAAASGVEDPALREALLGVAADEERHAALAWRTLRWMLKRDPSLRAAAREAFAAAVSEARGRPLGLCPDAPELGVLGSRARRAVHLRALEAVVSPMVEALGLA